MQKTLIWLVCVLINIIDVHGQPIPLKISTGSGILDTSKLSKLVYEANRKEAASYLSQYLNGKRNQNGKELAAFWLDLAIQLAWSDNITESCAAYSHYATSSAGQPDSPLLKANRLLCQSFYLSSADSSNQAADSLIASIAIRPDSGTINRILLADSYGELARLYKKTGDLFESSRNFERAIALNRKLNRLNILANNLSNMSSVLSKLNSSDQRADSILLESRSIYTKIDSLSAASQVLNELGVLYSRRLNFKKSLSYFMQSLTEKSGISGLSKQEFIVVTNNIGHCYQNLRNTDSAKLYFQKAVDYAIEAGWNPARYYANLGICYGSNKEYTQALEYFQISLFWLDSIACFPTDLATNPRIIRVTPPLADFTAFKALTFHGRYDQLNNPDDLINGLKTYMVALEMMDTLRFMYSFESKPYLSSEAKVHFFNALDMALDLHKRTGEKKYLEQAFRLSERNKSAILNEFLRTNQAREFMGKVAPWITREDSIKQVINKIESRLISFSTGTDSNTDSTISMQTRLSDLTDELRNIGITARRENPAFFQMVYSNHGYLPGDIQKSMNRGEALIDYTVVGDNMIVMVLTHDTLYPYRDTLPVNFRENLRAFRTSITPYVDAKVFQEFSRTSNLMYEYLFAPIENFKGINQLIILPDEELGFLPFEAFVSDTLKPKGSDFRKLSYLNRKYQISYISSHEQLFQFRNNLGERAKSTIYAFAPFISKGAKMDTLNLLPLENSGKEIDFISKYFRTRVFKNEQAGEQSLRRAFQKKSVIAISTHSIMNSARPLQSRLLLNPSEPDGSLYLFEMMSLKIRSSLVILNACNTGTGQLQIGEGIMSMARGFQFAGVPSVITTLWPVDDRSSASVMKFFFQGLHDGMDQREALMKARNAYLDQATKASGAPYFWAGQVLIGNPGSLSIHYRTNPLFVIIPLILAALILTFFRVFHKKVRE